MPHVVFRRHQNAVVVDGTEYTYDGIPVEVYRTLTKAEE